MLSVLKVFLINYINSVGSCSSSQFTNISLESRKLFEARFVDLRKLCRFGHFLRFLFGRKYDACSLKSAWVGFLILWLFKHWPFAWWSQEFIPEFGCKRKNQVHLAESSKPSWSISKKITHTSPQSSPVSIERLPCFIYTQPTKAFSNAPKRSCFPELSSTGVYFCLCCFVARMLSKRVCKLFPLTKQSLRRWMGSSVLPANWNERASCLFTFIRFRLPLDFEHKFHLGYSVCNAYKREDKALPSRKCVIWICSGRVGERYLMQVQTLTTNDLICV